MRMRTLPSKGATPQAEQAHSGAAGADLPLLFPVCTGLVDLEVPALEDAVELFHDVCLLPDDERGVVCSSLASHWSPLRGKLRFLALAARMSNIIRWMAFAIRMC